MADNSTSPVFVLDRAAIFAAQDRRIEPVHVPEWANGNPEAVIYVRSMSGAERSRYELSITGNKRNNEVLNIQNLHARMVAITACDANGNAIFSETDVKLLGEKNAAVLSRIVDKAQELSGLTKKDVEELAKNSETPAEADDSTSD